MRRLALTAAAAAFGLGLASCGLHDPYASTATKTAPRATTATSTTATVTSSTVRAATPPANTTARPPSTPPVLAGKPGTPNNVVYRFATAYANVSAAGADARVQALISLATPAYAGALKSGAAQAKLEATRGLPPGGRMVGRVSNIQLSSQGSFDHGLVTVEQTLKVPRGSAQQPFTSTFVVDLLQVGRSWRVADFEAQP